MNRALLRSETKTLSKKEKDLLILPGLSPRKRRSKSASAIEIKSEENPTIRASHSESNLKVEIIDISSDSSNSVYSDTISDMPNQQQNPQNAPNANMGPRVRDALEMIPVFSGGRDGASIFEFVAGCKDAKSILPENFERQLSQLIKTKLKSGALQLVRGHAYDNIDELIKVLQDIYASKRSSTEICGDLSRLVQGENEDVATYFNRACMIQYQLLDKLKEELNNANNLPPERTLEVEKACAKYFVLGLNKEIFPLMTEKETLNEAGPQAIEIEAMLKNRANLYLTINTTCLLCNKSDHLLTNCPTLQSTSNLVCQLCKGYNHTAENCNIFYLCQLCNSKGHSATTCPMVNKQNNEICQICKLVGHSAKNCVMSPIRVAQVNDTVCSACNKMGHIAKNCRANRQCYTCGKNGHFSRDCRNKNQNNDNWNRNNNNRPNYPNQNARRNDNNNNNYQNRNMNNNRNNNNNRNQNNQMFCSFCDKDGHTIDRCFI